jgi:hypothetical protein
MQKNFYEVVNENVYKALIENGSDVHILISNGIKYRRREINSIIEIRTAEKDRKLF